ncbi:FecR domain-containing protein [Chitinophaga sp. 212800010-3]|uniref:FecR family protein n=1 Tax=unclassified Chitinophaga TaxID=2619133 RepID=UPI002DE509A6|nr:Ferric-dicitrate binding protein FerR, regulates iron transport through sigma-19 [Chitinophaga sp. 212800010-3]
MSQYEFDDLLEKYLLGRCTPQEEKLVLAWYRSFIEESEISISDEEKQQIESRIWANVAATAAQEEAPVVKMRPVRIYRLALAGCLAVVAALGAYWLVRRGAAPRKEMFTEEQVPAEYVYEYNESDKNQHVALADGSIVTLEPGSQVYYPPVFRKNTRDVFLSGNAFFEVAPDASRHFIVHTSEGVLAEVLGTSFQVSHDKEHHKVEVAVVTGKVSVYEHRKKDTAAFIPSAGGIIITPNQKVTYKTENNQFTTSLVDDPKPVEVARTVSFAYEEAPLEDVLHALEETYAITIETDNEQLRKRHFTGDITKQNLYGKLDIICQSIQASYEVKGTTIYIKNSY